MVRTEEREGGVKEAGDLDLAIVSLRKIRETLLSVGDCTIDSGFRLGITDAAVVVEVASGYTTTWSSAESVESPAFEARLRKMKEDHPREHYYDKPRVQRSLAALRREEVAAAREQIAGLYQEARPTLQRLVLQHGIGQGWQANYQTEWVQQAEPVYIEDGLVYQWPMSARLRGARDVHHTHTYQAGVIGSVLNGPNPLGHFDGLEAALICDYVCMLCKADALRMVDELLAKVVPDDREAAANTPSWSDVTSAADQEMVRRIRKMGVAIGTRFAVKEMRNSEHPSTTRTRLDSLVRLGILGKGQHGKSAWYVRAWPRDMPPAMS